MKDVIETVIGLESWRRLGVSTDTRCMPSPTISLSMMQFESGPLMQVEPDQASRGQLVCDTPPVEMDLMLSLVAEPEPIRMDDFREREPQRRAG